ncbi:MAG: hypothetical protein MJ200_03095 [Mycoplasmoidaceae bacterium]|nr:hypothetical protein [Mycoplasmoidaceae bacterium]
MNTTLLVLVIILVVVAIILGIYLIITFRKIHIVAKKIDYLVEDLTYKSEQLTPVVDSIVKVSDFIDILDSVLKQKSQQIIKQSSGNQESIYQVAKEVKHEIKKIRNKNQNHAKKI